MAIPVGALGRAVWAYLLQAGKDPSVHMLTDVLVVSGPDGDVIAAWNAAVLGPQPSLATLEAALAQYPGLDKQHRRDKTLWTPQITALTRAVHKRLRDAGVDQVQMGDFRAVIEAEYDLLVS